MVAAGGVGWLAVDALNCGVARSPGRVRCVVASVARRGRLCTGSVIAEALLAAVAPALGLRRIDEGWRAGYSRYGCSSKDLVALCPFDERLPLVSRISPALNIGKCFQLRRVADYTPRAAMEGCGFEEPDCWPEV